MFGAFKFVQQANKKGIKPIVGCEFFISEDRKKTKFTRDNPDKRHNQILLAKNKDGYNNLSKLSSLGYLEGLYGLYPRIDKELIKEYLLIDLDIRYKGNWDELILKQFLNSRKFFYIS